MTERLNWTELEALIHWHFSSRLMPLGEREPAWGRKPGHLRKLHNKATSCLQMGADRTWPGIKNNYTVHLKKKHYLILLTAWQGPLLWLGWWRICLQCRRPGFDPWVGKIPWRREKLSTAVFWPGEFHGLYSLWGCKELDMTEWLSLWQSGKGLCKVNLAHCW